ncbi:MAG TPA: hypothetical protein VFQ51_15080 [Vicinamibacteria bacterium]|nr:hypothetical protein [Vicinamibacteria bacterium]
MNLLDAMADEFSEAARPDRLHEGRARLPASLLRRHVAANRNLAARADELESLADELERPPAAANPELYPFLIAARFAPAAQCDALADKIRWHAGLSDELGAGLTPGFHRSSHAPGVHRETAGRLEPVEGCWAGAPGTAIRVYFPRPGLFRDLLGADLYPDVPATRADADLLRDVEDALGLVRFYDERLYDEVRRCFSVLVLTTDFGTVRSSFNLRLRYLGGLFLNPFHETPLGLAEGLVHEYYHQRLWHWWWEEPLDGMPGEDVQVTSPITGRRRPVPVMTHALLIYVALQAMHATLARRLEGDAARAADARSVRLSAGIGPLGEALRQAVPAGTRASSFLDLLGRLGPAGSVDAEGKLG